MGFGAIPGPRGGFFAVYILAPVIGALLGAAGQQMLRQPSSGNGDIEEILVGDDEQ